MTRIVFDSSVLIAAAIDSHVSFERASRSVATVDSVHTLGFASQHAFAETFVKLTGMPLHPRISPIQAMTIVQAYRSRLEVVELDYRDYESVFDVAVRNNVTGAGLYDLLHIRAAQKVEAHRIVTLNLREFARLASWGNVDVEGP